MRRIPLALGEPLPVIGKLLGHSDIETTARYAHLAHDPIHETAERIAASIAAGIPNDTGRLRLPINFGLDDLRPSYFPRSAAMGSSRAARHAG